MIKFIVLAVVIVAGYFAFPPVAKHIIAKQEYHECLTWKDQEENQERVFSRMGSIWYSTSWQKEQCEQFSIYFSK